MSETLGADLPSFPMPHECPMRPPVEYRRLREQGPASRVRMPDGQVAWLITGYDLSRRLLADPRLSSDRMHPAFPAFPLALSAKQRAALLRDNRLNIQRSVIGMDAPEHDAHRKMLISEFSVRRIAALRPRIQAIVEKCTDDLLAAPQPADLVEHVSLAVPSLVICELLGVRSEQRHGFHEWTNKLIGRAASVQERIGAATALNNALDELITRQESGTPNDDVIGRLIVRNRKDRVMSHEDILGNAVLLLTAGHETTANMISLGTVALLENPEQKAQVMADSSLLPAAVEEMLRYFSIVENATARVAIEDIELDGVTIGKDEGVVVSGLAADWDESEFPNPDKLDFQRVARHHLAFGYGVHQCLGQNLARLELEIVFETLLRKAPNLRLAIPAAELPYKDEASVYGIHSVPVNF
jgi:cytochrome P450